MNFSPLFKTIMMLFAALIQTVGAAILAAKGDYSYAFWGSLMLTLSGTVTALVAQPPSNKPRSHSHTKLSK